MTTGITDLRNQWREIPQGSGIFSDDLLKLDDDSIVKHLQDYGASEWRAESRGWYRTLYGEFMRDRIVFELGSGLGVDGLYFLQQGAQWTFSDITQSNLEVARRACKQLGLSAKFVYIDDRFENFTSLEAYDAVWCNWSLTQVPFSLAKAECLALLPHLKPRGRWIELTSARDKMPEPDRSLSEWEQATVQQRLAWREQYDLSRMRRRFFPAQLDVILDYAIPNTGCQWYDFTFAADQPFAQNQIEHAINIDLAGNVKLFDGSSYLSEHDPVHVETLPATWGYAASIDIGSIIRSDEKLTDRTYDHLVLELTIRVDAGAIGMLLTTGDIAETVGQEQMVSADMIGGNMIIPVPRNKLVEFIIFRNTAEGQQRSRFSIESATLRAASKLR